MEKSDSEHRGLSKITALLNFFELQVLRSKELNQYFLNQVVHQKQKILFDWGLEAGSQVSGCEINQLE